MEAEIRSSLTTELAADVDPPAAIAVTNRLERTADLLFEETGRVEDALRHVLSPFETPDSDLAENDRPMQAPLTTRLIEIEDRISRAIMRLGAIRDRLEI